MSERERISRDIAEEITFNNKTDVTPKQIKDWDSWDVEEWIGAFGFEWDDKEDQWINVR